MEQKILIIDDEKEILDIIEIIIESEFSFEILRADSGRTGIEILKENSVSLIISDYSMDSGTGGEIFLFNKDHENVPFIMVSGGFLEDYKELEDFRKTNPLNTYIQKPMDEDFFIESIRKSMNDEADLLSTSEFRRLKIDHVLTFLKTNKDIYIKLSGEKYLKIVHAGELFEKNQLIKYQEKGEDYVYFKKPDFESFVKEVLSKLNKSILGSINLSDTVTLGAIGYEFVHSSLRDMGLTNDHVDFVNSLVEKSVSSLMENKEVEILLQSFFHEKGYLVSHTMTAIYISFLICQKVEYTNETSVEKLVFAAIVHDLGISDSSLSQIIDRDSKEFEALSGRDKKDVLNHMFTSVKLLENFKSIPNDVENIILEHHENTSGTGFPRNIAANRISPLSAIFILSLRVSHFLYFNKLSTSGQMFKKDLEENCNKGNFKKPLAALLSCLEKALKSS
ncbi:hypothetical protein A9Q84_09110 [Halobacteriovorax marinus]|uniref:Response regulatory domain-containing protein n=1 Tax=Halobacteriovorax marinus TaxID=97084 RepID=A0A1Y5F6I2_9BACT|nr:hypothetical protein A9Q84_09110 [Halobacteriovorax marinus]